MASIARMNGGTSGKGNEQILKDVTLNKLNTCSVLSSVNYARENARAARDSISSELWEATNTFYHRLGSYPTEQIQTDGPLDFCQYIIERSTIIKGLMDRTLIHDTGWSIVNFGIKLERALQVIRILKTKLEDVAGLHESMIGGPLENYQWTTLMKSCQAFDMSRRYFKRSPGRSTALEFLLLFPDFTNSVQFCLQHLSAHMRNIDDKYPYPPYSTGFLLGRMQSRYAYLTVDEILEDTTTFLDNSLKELHGIGSAFEQQYLTY